MSINLYSTGTVDSLLAAKLSDAPSDGSTYGRNNAAWAVISGGGGLTISTLSNAATSTLAAAVPTAGQALTYDGTDLIWATVSGSAAWGAITGTLSSQTDLQTALDDKLPLAGGTMTGAITFDAVGLQNINKGTFDNSTGGYNGISLTCAVGYELNWQGGHIGNWYSGSFQTIYADSPIDITHAGGLVLSDPIAGFPATLTGALFSFSGGCSMSIEETNITGFNVVLPASGTVTNCGSITFSDSTVQTTAAVAPPSADVYKANAIVSNINYFYGSSGTWVGGNNPVPTVAASASWGVYNPTDGYIAYSYSSGTSFYLASSTTTNANLSVQVSGSNSSFYIN